MLARRCQSRLEKHLGSWQQSPCGDGKSHACWCECLENRRQGSSSSKSQHSHVDIAARSEAVTELRSRFTTCMASASVLQGLLLTEPWKWAKGSLDSQAFAEAHVKLQEELKTVTTRKLMTEALPTVKDLPGTDLQSCLQEICDRVEASLGEVDRTSKKLHALHSAHMSHMT